MKKILMVADMAATFGGNFIESLLMLQNKLSNERVEYLLPEKARDREWIHRLSKVYYTDWSYKSLREIWKVANKDTKVDVIHFHFIGASKALLCRLAFEGRIKRVWHLHMHVFAKSKYPMILKKAVYSYVYSNSYKICVSRAVADEVKRCSKSNIYIVYNAIDFTRLRHCTQENYIREKSNSAINCMIMGNNFVGKGVDIAIKAVYQMRSKGYDVILYVAMNDEFIYKMREFLKKCSALENVDWNNFVKIIPTRNDIATYFRKIDIFLSPSREDTWVMAIDEAMYCDCMVIASNIPGQNENNVPGFEWVGNPNNKDISSDIADKALYLYSLSSKEKTKRTQAAIKYMEINYSLDAWSKKIMEIYDT